MNGEPDTKPAEDKGVLARFSPIQLGVAGLALAVILVIVLLIVSTARLM
jgi:hypothetical protein